MDSMSFHQRALAMNSDEGKLTHQYDKPIWAPGTVQPHGLLLSIHKANLVIDRIGANAESYFGEDAETILGQPYQNVLGDLFGGNMAQTLEALGLNRHIHMSLTLSKAKDKGAFDALIHQTDRHIIVELEQEQQHRSQAFYPTRRDIDNALLGLRNKSTLSEFLEGLSAAVSNLLKFDRTLLYRFDADGAGEVVAENLRDRLPSFQGLHYPSTDIPVEARDLYLRGMVRFVPDLSSDFITLLPHADREGETIDLGFALLRSVDSCCIEYHKNIAAAALLVIPLIQAGKLWGLISCLHSKPKYFPLPLVENLSFFGKIVEVELSNTLAAEDTKYKAKLHALLDDFLASISRAESLVDALITPAPRLLELVGASGAAVCLDREITLVGSTPTKAAIEQLLNWASDTISEDVFHTHALASYHPPAEAYADVASGLLLLQISKIQRYTILWFREEIIQTINWAGNPQDSLVESEDGSLKLSPRHSFELWQETVRNTSAPWESCEIDNATSLRSAIVGIVLRKADELARLVDELQRSNRELNSFAYAASHDLKEPLRGIYNYSIFLLEDYEDSLDEGGIDRLQTILSLSQRMEALLEALLYYARLGEEELTLQDVDLNQIVKQLAIDYRASYNNIAFRIELPHPLPILRCDPILIREVISNLIQNALKYNTSSEPAIEIGWSEVALATAGKTNTSQPNAYQLYFRDNGIGIRQRHLGSIFRLFKRLHSRKAYGGGTGAGLAIVKKIVERHDGDISVESVEGEGSTFTITLPIR